jgi:hypothetical protein
LRGAQRRGNPVWIASATPRNDEEKLDKIGINSYNGSMDFNTASHRETPRRALLLSCETLRNDKNMTNELMDFFITRIKKVDLPV